MLPLSDTVDLRSCLKTEYDPHAAQKLRNTNKHMGQRKLLLSEIQLLTEHYASGGRHPKVVYVGAAPGTHLLLLSELFPNTQFVLYDGARFDPDLIGKRMFDLRTTFFTDEICKALMVESELSGKPILLVSDIRSDGGGGGAASFEQQVMWDMLSQKRWVQLIHPLLSLLKFRLPYTLGRDSSVPYLQGKLLFGIWPKKDSTETRLLVKRSDINRDPFEYNFGDYEQTLAFHNQYTRRTCFASALPQNLQAFVRGKDTNVPQYCGCYDCAAELTVLDRYARDAARRAGREDLADNVRGVAKAVKVHAQRWSQLVTLSPTLETEDQSSEVIAAIQSCRRKKRRTNNDSSQAPKKNPILQKNSVHHVDLHRLL